MPRRSEMGRATATAPTSRRAFGALAAAGLATRPVLAQTGSLPGPLPGSFLGPGPAVTLLVGASPGSAADSWARGFAPFLERHWPHAVVAVVNRPGEGGLAAARSVAGA